MQTFEGRIISSKTYKNFAKKYDIKLTNEDKKYKSLPQLQKEIYEYGTKNFICEGLYYFLTPNDEVIEVEVLDILNKRERFKPITKVIPLKILNEYVFSDTFKRYLSYMLLEHHLNRFIKYTDYLLIPHKRTRYFILGEFRKMTLEELLMVQFSDIDFYGRGMNYERQSEIEIEIFSRIKHLKNI